METIIIKHCNTEQLDYDDFGREKFELHDMWLVHRNQCKCKVFDDDKQYKVEKKFDYEYHYRKDKIAAVGFAWENIHCAYCIDLEIMGCSTATVFFETRQEAIEVRDKILKWLLT